MFFWLAELMRETFGPLNVFRYLTFRVPAALVTALLITMMLYPWFIRRLQGKKIGESIREDGPASHQTKAGTPTMGGSLIVLALLLSSILWMDLNNVFVWMTLFVVLAYAILGFVDDFQKFRSRLECGARRSSSGSS